MAAADGRLDEGGVTEATLFQVPEFAPVGRTGSRVDGDVEVVVSLGDLPHRCALL